MIPPSLIGLRRVPRRLERMISAGILSCGLLGLPGFLTLSVAQEPGFRVNRLIEALDKGQPAISAETWTFIDGEHNPFNIATLRQTILKLLANKNGAGQPVLAPIVRIPAEGDELVANRWMIKQALESGAMGIIVPKVDTAEDALKMVKAMRFPPLRDSKHPEPRGVRGGGGPGREWGLKNPSDYRSVADIWPLNPSGEIIALPLIETVDGLNSVNAILDVPGVSGVFVGPSDLAQSHGLLDHEDSEVQASIKKIADACVAKKKHCGILAIRPDIQTRYLNWGFKIIVRSDVPNSFTPPI
jgi:4-hydroxy-2-oxoheptanedioate aldolase